VLVLTVRAAAKVLLGRGATFRVTPKARAVGGRFSTLRMLRTELVVAAVATVFGFVALGTVMPLLALIGPTLGGLYLDTLASRPAPPEPVASGAIPGRTIRHADTVGV
jgi:hypothetical protein